MRAYRNREAGIKVERQATVAVRVDEDMLERAVSRLGWRIYVTNQVREQLSLEQAVLAYRSEYLVERSLGRLKGRPLSLTPMYVQRDDHATGLIRLLSIALRVLTLIEFVGRRQLALEKEEIGGLYAGNPKRKTARPTAERLLEAFQELTLTVIELPQQAIRHVTPLSSVQLRILEIFRLCLGGLYAGSKPYLLSRLRNSRTVKNSVSFFLRVFFVLFQVERKLCTRCWTSLCPSHSSPWKGPRTKIALPFINRPSGALSALIVVLCSR